MNHTAETSLFTEALSFYQTAKAKLLVYLTVLTLGTGLALILDLRWGFPQETVLLYLAPLMALIVLGVPIAHAALRRTNKPYLVDFSTPLKEVFEALQDPRYAGYMPTLNSGFSRAIKVDAFQVVIELLLNSTETRKAELAELRRVVDEMNAELEKLRNERATRKPNFVVRRYTPYRSRTTPNTRPNRTTYKRA